MFIMLVSCVSSLLLVMVSLEKDGTKDMELSQLNLGLNEYQSVLVADYP